LPSKTITIEKVTSKDGTTKKNKPFTRWGIKADDGEWYNSFQNAVGKLAQDYEGTEATFELTYEVGEYGNDITQLAGPVTNGDAPAKKADKPNLGTGDYVKGQTAPADRRAMNAAVALRHATVAMAHTIFTDMTPKDAMETRIEPLAEAMFMWLNGKSQVVEEKDVPF
jgi:hypothetical protein